MMRAGHTPPALPPVSDVALTEASTAPYLRDLNVPQREAVEAMDPALLVLSGAGTGKTRVLTTRLAHLMHAHHVHPHRILAVTFTNRAAMEMRERVMNAVGARARDMWLGTFHALAARILRAHAERIGLRPEFTILDTDDQLRLIKQLVQAANLDDKKWPPRAILGAISRWKDRGLMPEQVSSSESRYNASIHRLYEQYQQRLKDLNAVDFGDLLLYNLVLFRQNPDVLAHYHQQFQHLLVDEYQDTNVAQYLWLRLLAQGGAQVCCVGDDDQSIYGWRGAEIDNILRFDKDFSGARVIRLEQNYRSTAPILAAASALIAHNKGRLGKTLWTAEQGGSPIVVCGVWDGEEEARWVGDEIETQQRQGVPLSSIAVLVRAGFQTREFEDRFIALGVPYRVVGGPRFYERQEIRDALAYVRLAAYPNDDLAFERIVNVPKRGIGATTMQTLNQLARRSQTSLVQATHELIGGDELKSNVRSALRHFVQQLEVWQHKAKDQRPGEFARFVLDDAGYTTMWQTDTSPEAPGRLENLKELVNAMDEFDSLQGFLEHVSLVMEINTQGGDERVTIMTLHGAKGLEFDTVFLTGWEEGLFPHPRALEETGEAGLEEERRLAYVGLTRAKRKAFISFAGSRRIHNLWQSNPPSRFISDLPPAVLEMQNNSLQWRRNQGRSDGRHDHGRQGQYGGASRAGEPLGESSEGRSYRYAAAAPITPSASGFQTGDRIFHIKFGYGRLESVEGNYLTIDFDHSGRKRVVASFVERA